MAANMLTAFDEWLGKRNGSLAIQMAVAARAPASIRLRFVGISACIEVLVLADEVVVIVTREDICWDILAEFECKSVAAASGVASGHGNPDDRQAYPTNFALFSDFVFGPLADWIATSLMPARAIRFGGSRRSGSTCASLLPADPITNCSTIVSLRSLSVRGGHSH
jgi:hypothetical protein